MHSMNAATFNRRYPVGTKVIAYPGARPDDFRDAPRLLTRTRSKAEVLGDDDVVWVDGHSACIALTHIHVVAAADLSPEAMALREVPHNPRPLCRSFRSKPAPDEYWCVTCGWMRPLHTRERHRQAISEVLACLPEGGADRD